MFAVTPTKFGVNDYFLLFLLLVAGGLVLAAILRGLGPTIQSLRKKRKSATASALANGSSCCGTATGSGAPVVKTKTPSTVVNLRPAPVAGGPNRTLSVWSASHIGGRANQEDAVFVREEDGLFLIADGMGGQECGEKASGAVVEEFARVPTTAGDNWFRLGVEASRANMKQLAANDPACKEMGTTLTAARRSGSLLELFWLGDSHFFRLRAGELKRLTVEHSLAYELFRRGNIKEEEIADHKFRNVLHKYVSPQGSTPAWDSETFEMLPGDVYLLCSDGLTKMVDDDVIEEILRTEACPSAAVAKLVDAANAGGGKDNITVIVVRVEAPVTDQRAA